MNQLKFSPIKILTRITLVLLIANGSTATESANEPPPGKTGPKLSLSMSIVLSCFLLTFLLFCFFFFYFRHCAQHQLSLASTAIYGGQRTSMKLPTPRGLDPAVIAMFVSFTYSAVKQIKIGQHALECAVCLNEFQDHESLRLLPECNHVFHRNCIDEWLALHVTCPVCRANLVPKHDNKMESCWSPTEAIKGHASVDVIDTNHELPPTRKLPRSYSMGHSIVRRPVENAERYTLRLPVDVRDALDTLVTNASMSPDMAHVIESRMKKGGLRSASASFVRGSDYFEYERFGQERGRGDPDFRITKSLMSCGVDDSRTSSQRFLDCV